jgi:hypothetical protein
MVGLLFLIGLLGFTPFATAWRFAARLNAVSVFGDETESQMSYLSMLGGFGAVLIPAGLVFSIAADTQNKLFDDLQKAQASNVRPILQELATNWTCYNSCLNWMLKLSMSHQLPIEINTLESELSQILGRRVSFLAKLAD